MTLTPKTIFACPPTSFTLAYEINAWMNTNNAIDPVHAQAQWQALHDTLIQLGATVDIVAGGVYPDSVFIANAGLIIDNTFILSRFRFLQRQPEEDVWREQFEKRGYTVIQPPEQHYFEGAGDALFFRGTLIGGTGFRSTQNTYGWIEKEIGIPTLPVELIDPHFYHLDTCFCPLTPDSALIYPGAFSPESLQAIKSLGGTLIEISKEEAHRFACNAVAIGSHVMLPPGNSETELQLKNNGFTPVPLPMDEYMKSGGAVKCITLTPYITTAAGQ